MNDNPDRENRISESSVFRNSLSEMWLQLHYRLEDKTHRFNLPLNAPEKKLDGVRIMQCTRDIPLGRRVQFDVEVQAPVQMESFILTSGLSYGKNLKSVYVNGFQSWTVSRERFPGERIRRINWSAYFLKMEKTGDTELFSYSEKKGQFHGYTYVYLRYPNKIFLIGSLDENSGHSIFETDLRHDIVSITKDVQGKKLENKTRLADIVFLEGSEEEVFDEYARLKKIPPRRGKKVFAWTTRYKTGAISIDERLIDRYLVNLRKKNLPLDYFIVNSGWSDSLGDWTPRSLGFPSGMSALADKIRENGFSPGIQYAPFAVGPESKIFRLHKDWLIKDNSLRPSGRRVQGGLFFALDITLSEVRQYIEETIRQIRDEWGYSLIKLDLLYVVAMIPSGNMSRSELMHMAIDFLNSIKGDAVYLTNGVPLSAVFGKTNYCQISAETTPYWENRFLRSIHYRERSSTVNALRSVVGRRHLNERFFINASSAFHLGGLKRYRNSMDFSRRYTQLFLQLLFSGFLCTDDNPASYSDAEEILLKRLFPLVQPRIENVNESRRTVWVEYYVKNRRFISMSNLSERIRSFTLPHGLWFVCPSHKNRSYHILGRKKFYLKPGETRNYLFLQSNDPFAGSNGHMFPGNEIAKIDNSGDNWTITPDSSVANDFQIWLNVPDNPSIRINGEPVVREKTEMGVFLKATIRNRF